MSAPKPVALCMDWSIRTYASHKLDLDALVHELLAVSYADGNLEAMRKRGIRRGKRVSLDTHASIARRGVGGDNVRNP